MPRWLLPHVEAEKLRALAVADDFRSARLPDVPTTAESGFPRLKGTYWSGVIVPPAPPERWSTMTDWPRDAPSRSAKNRATISALFPGGNGTIMVIGRLG
jgi:hypothetical protein